MTNTNVIKSVVPSIAAFVFKAKESQSYLEPQTCAIAALSIFHMMTSFTREDVVPAAALLMLAEESIKRANSSNNDMKQYHYADSPMHLIGLAKHLGFVAYSEDKTFTMTLRWIELVTTKETAIPLTTRVTAENRRKPYVKGGKVKPSKLAKEATEFLQDTAYHVDGPMIAIVGKTIDMITRSGQPLPVAIQQELHVWNNSKAMVAFEELYSDYFDDQRGRKYHCACAGPNPQSSDFARSLYSINESESVNKLDESGSLTEQYVMFMNELNDIAGGKFVESAYLTRVAQNPAGALAHMLQSGDAPKKPFTYIRLALDWYQFETTGACLTREGFGLDAKCSGTQYMAMIAGNLEMCRATGLVMSESKSSDPYQLSLVQLVKRLDGKLTPTAEALDICLNPKDGRNFIKTPYMAIQYGGGVGALTGSKDFVEGVMNIYKDQYSPDVDGDMYVAEFAETCVEAIKAALGDKINMFITKTAQAVLKKLEETGKEFLTYRHTDGFLVNKPCFPSREVCPAFSIRVDSQTRVIFGQEKDNKPWSIRESKPTKEEFARTFVVNFIQGIDALVARTVAKYAKKAGLRGFTSIHDCFRCCLADAPKMMGVIRQAYIEIFVENNQFENLSKQIGGINMYHENVITEEMLNSPHAYYFCQ